MILILGYGFVGETLSKKLLENGHQIKVFSNNIGNVSNIEYRTGDWKDIDKHLDFFEDAEMVIQTIHTTVPYSSMLNIYDDASDNILPNIKLLEILREKGIRNSIFISSGGAVYGLPKTELVNEYHDTNPISAYGVSKLCVENYIRLFNYHYNLNISIVRPSNLYGPGQSIKKTQGIIAHIVSCIMKKNEFNIWGDGKGEKDYLYIDDFIDALILLIEKFPSSPQIYNIASGESYTIIELIEKIEKELREKLITKKRVRQDFDVSSIVLDASFFRSSYKWTPKMSIKQGIKEIIKCIK